MHLIKRTAPASLAAALLACGPEVHDKPDTPDWMLATFSNRQVGDRSIGLNSVTHYEFRAGGELVVGGVQDCATNTPRDEEELAWVSEGEDVLRVDQPEPGLDIEAWRISSEGDCGNVFVDRIRSDGVVLDTGTWYRGAVCLQKLPPCPVGTECDGCEAVLCEGEHVDCE